MRTFVVAVWRGIPWKENPPANTTGQGESGVRISVIDGSNYFRGLLLLIRKDKRVTQPEIDMMRRIGKTLGFEKEFCENAIADILENRYIEDAPPVFSAQELAIKFVKDGIAVSFSDADPHPAEEEWLRSTATKNGLDPKWFDHELENTQSRGSHSGRLEVDDLTVMY